MNKIVLSPGQPNPPVIHKTGRLFDHCKGGPYKYGDPIYFNAEAINRLYSKSKNAL